MANLFANINMALTSLYLLFFLSCVSAADIAVGTSLEVGKEWISPAGTFALGFIKNNASKFRVGIWYPNTAEKTVVWTAATDEGTYILGSAKSSLVLQSNGLFLRDGIDTDISSCNGKCNVKNARMLENGKDEFVWSTFEHPKDTLLPEQQLKSSMQLSSGRYQLRVGKNTVALQSIDFPAESGDDYWYMSSINSNGTLTPVLNLTKNGLLSFYDSAGMNGDDRYDYLFANVRAVHYAIDYNNVHVTHRRIVLEKNGNLRMYSLYQGNNTWKVTWQAVMDECSILAACGPFGICAYRPSFHCTCPPGFRQVDDSDTSAGCDYSVPLGNACGTGSSSVTTVELTRVDYNHNDYNFDRTSHLSMEECKKSCLDDCKCLGAFYRADGTGWCFHKNFGGKIFNGRQMVFSAAGSQSVQPGVFFMKVSRSDSSLPTSSQEDLFVTNVSSTSYPIIVQKVESYFTKKVHVALVVLSIGEFILFTVICCGLFLCWRSDKQKMLKRFATSIEGLPVQFSYRELQVATKNFSEKLGSGSFGSVYKGILPDGREVAVKQLEGATQGQKEFKAEVSMLGSIRHVNLVRLIGYCAAGRHRLLVIEYMTNGSLERFIFPSSTYCGWDTRWNIALGIARGITYLHEECEECIIHCDIKPENILLDDKFCPKVSDFGLAKLMSRDRPLSVTTIRGTRGYLAPEWISDSQITAKVDVYSFGMVLLEILTGRDKFIFTASALETEKWNLSEWAFNRYMESNLDSIVDPELSKEEVNWTQFERMLKVAFWCIQGEPSMRPIMSKVVQMLEDTVEVPQSPYPNIFKEGATITVTTM